MLRADISGQALGSCCCARTGLLEHHTHRSGKDSIDHPKGGVCGVMRELSVIIRGWAAADGVSETVVATVLLLRDARIDRPHIFVAFSADLHGDFLVPQTHVSVW